MLSTHAVLLLHVHNSYIDTGLQMSLAPFDGTEYGAEYASFPAKALMTASAMLEDTQGHASCCIETHLCCYVMPSPCMTFLTTGWVFVHLCRDAGRSGWAPPAFLTPVESF